MAHEISQIDRQQGISQAWHGLTEVIPALSLVDCWLTKWEAQKRPLYREINGDFQKTENCEIFCSDMPQVTLGKAVDCESYGLISNADFLKCISEAITGITGAKVASVGSVCERTKVFVSVQLKELEVFKAAGREFRPFLNFGHSFDQSSPFWVNSSNVCTVCANTFGMNLRVKDSPLSSRMKHTKNVVMRLDNVSELVDGFLGAQAEFKAIMETLNSREMSSEDAKPFFAGLLADGKREEISTRRLNQIESLDRLFVKGRGNSGETRADAFQAVTEYATHESAGGLKGQMQRQIASSEFGAGATLKTRALSALQSEETIAELISAGVESLKMS